MRKTDLDSYRNTFVCYNSNSSRMLVRARKKILELSLAQTLTSPIEPEPPREIASLALSYMMTFLKSQHPESQAGSESLQRSFHIFSSSPTMMFSGKCPTKNPFSPHKPIPILPGIKIPFVYNYSINSSSMASPTTIPLSVNHQSDPHTARSHLSAGPGPQHCVRPLESPFFSIRR